MATNLQIDDHLISKAVELGGHKTKRAAVNEALQKYVEHLQQIKILSLFDKVDYDSQYNYKKQRARK